MLDTTVNQTHSMPPNASVAPSGGNPKNAPRNERMLRGKPAEDMDKLRGLGTRLTAKFTEYRSHRQLVELKWERNLRQFLGEYDPDVKKYLDAARSQAYPRLTRVKCVSMLARIMNLLFPTTETNWGIEPSPVPNLEKNDLLQVLQQAMDEAQKAGGQLTDEVIEAAVRAFAKVRSENLSLEIADQLAEIGGNRKLDYVALCRKVLQSGIIYGMGVVKGPFVRQQKVRTWVRNPATGVYQPQEYMANRPQFEFVPIWDYYPDMTAKYLHQMDGQFHRMVFSKAQLRELADRPDFFGDEIKNYLQATPNGNWKEQRHETSLRTMGTQQNVNVLSGHKYEIIVWDGYVGTQDLSECGIELPDAATGDIADCSIWMLDNRIIKAVVSPWVELEPDERVQMYHHFMFEEDDSSLIGNGLPNIMRDSQMMVAAATRMLLDNASVVCGPNLEVNTDLLRADQDANSVQPYKIWYREGMGAEAAAQAVREIKFDSHIADLKQVVEMGHSFADMETFVNPATGGDMAKMPSEPFRSAAGASLMNSQLALPFKDVVRNFDRFTESAINALIVFNRHFNPNPEVQGDHTVIARGSSSLMAKEVRGMALDMLAQTVQDEEREYVDWYEVLKERLRVRDVDIRTVVVNTDKRTSIDNAKAQKQQKDEEQMQELLRAEVRKLLADATKSLTAADSNAASAEQKTAKAQVDVVNAILAGLEKGVAPSDVHALHQGADIPADLKKAALDAKKPAPAAGAPKGGSK